MTAFGLQVDDSQVVTFSYTFEGVGDVEGNINGYICEADGTFQFTVLPAHSMTPDDLATLII